MKLVTMIGKILKDFKSLLEPFYLATVELPTQ